MGIGFVSGDCMPPRVASSPRGAVDFGSGVERKAVENCKAGYLVNVAVCSAQWPNPRPLVYLGFVTDNQLPPCVASSSPCVDFVAYDVEREVNVVEAGGDELEGQAKQIFPIAALSCAHAWEGIVN